MPDLSITGQVAQIDAIGAVAQGVVSYGVKIGFDVQDDRIKPGMSLSATVSIESKRDVLTVPLSAVKTGGGNSYVEVLVGGQPQRKTVSIGLSDDTLIEIIDGLSAGEEVVTQTINPTAANSAAGAQTPTGGNQFRGGGAIGGEVMRLTR